MGLLFNAPTFSAIDEGSFLLDMTLVMVAWNMRDARQMTPKPTKTCSRASARFVGEKTVVGFGVVILGEKGAREDGSVCK